MPGKAMKCVIELDIHVVTCPGTFLRDYEYVYLHVEMQGLEARTKSVPPTFPLFFHERLKFERTFHNCTDPAMVAAFMKGEDVILELRQHTDYITDGKVLAHCSSNTHDFLYPAIPQYYGSGREILLYKTAKFKPIRITGEPVKLEFSSKTAISEVPEYYSSSPRRSRSPRRTRPTTSPERLFGFGSATVEPLPSWKYSTDFPSSNRYTVSRHNRSLTTPARAASPTRSLRYALDDLELKSTLRDTKSSTDPLLRYKSRYSPNLKAALGASDRIQRRVQDVIKKKDYSYDSDENLSDGSLEVLRDSLREERKALSEAIREADKEAFYRSVR